MRRLLGVLLGLALFASGAHATALVIVPTATGSSNADKGMKIQEDYVLNILSRSGADYVAIRDNQITNGLALGNLRRGRWASPGTTDTATYNPVIHLAFRVGSFGGKGYRPDSLTLRVNYPSVTHLFIGNHNEGGSFTTTAGANACSTGVQATAAYTGGNEHFDSTRVTYVVGNPGIRWVQNNGGATVPVSAARDSRGFRPVWGSRSSAHIGNMTGVYDDSFDGTYPTDPDSVALWVVLNRDNGTSTPIQRGTQASAVPMVFVQPASHYLSAGGEMSPYVAAFALADSLSGGGLFGTRSNYALPKRFAIHIDDGWKRGDPRNGRVGGVAIDDTTFFKASLDSLAQLGEKLVLGVEIESVLVAQKQNLDMRWWSRLGGILKFTPHCHEGTTLQADNSDVKQNTSGPYWRMQDIWGTRLPRIAWGGGTGLGQDSSFYALHKRSWSLMDSIFTRSRVDHVAMPPGDDWSPGTPGSVGPTWPLPMGLDSLFSFYEAAGGHGIRTNASSTTSLVSRRIGSYGYYSSGMDYAVSLTASGIADLRGQRGRVVACPTYPQVGSTVSYSQLSTGQGMRALNSIFLGRVVLSPVGTSVTEDEFAEAAVLAIHVGDLCSDKTGDPTRTGWYSIKYPVMAMRAINAVARRPMVRCVYPEELIP